MLRSFWMENRIKNRLFCWIVDCHRIYYVVNCLNRQKYCGFLTHATNKRMTIVKTTTDITKSVVSGPRGQCKSCTSDRRLASRSTNSWLLCCVTNSRHGLVLPNSRTKSKQKHDSKLEYNFGFNLINFE